MGTAYIETEREWARQKGERERKGGGGRRRGAGGGGGGGGLSADGKRGISKLLSMTLWLLHLCSSEHKTNKIKQSDNKATTNINVCWYNSIFFNISFKSLAPFEHKKQYNNTQYWQKLKPTCLHRKPCNNINSSKEKQRTENGRKHKTITGMCVALI